MSGVKLKPTSLSLESDREFLSKYHCYTDYLDDMIAIDDIRNLRSLRLARKLAEFGYRTTGDVLSKEEFLQRRKKVFDLEHPKYNIPPPICNSVILGCDPLIEQVAIRERACRVGSLQTIIYVRVGKNREKEYSSYIDLAERLDKTDMVPFYIGRQKLNPLPSDMAFFDWRRKVIRYNETTNFEILNRMSLGAVFRSRSDNLTIDPSPSVASPGVNTNRLELESPNYAHVIIFDHAVRNRGLRV